MKDTLVITDEPFEKIEALYDGERFCIRYTTRYSKDKYPLIHTTILNNRESKKLWKWGKKYFGGEK